MPSAVALHCAMSSQRACLPAASVSVLSAGPPSSLTQGAAALPRAASKTSGHCLIERADAEAVAAAEKCFAAIGGSDPGSEAVAAQQRLLRCVLKDVIQVGCREGLSGVAWGRAAISVLPLGASLCCSPTVNGDCPSCLLPHVFTAGQQDEKGRWARAQLRRPGRRCSRQVGPPAGSASHCSPHRRW